MQNLHVTSVLWLVAMTSGMTLPAPDISSSAPSSGHSVAMGTTTAASPASSSAAALAASSESTPASVADATTDGTSSVPAMPPGWEVVCQVTNRPAGSRRIHCDVTPSFRWKIDTFRDWAQKLEAGHVIDLEVTCLQHASIDIRWPYRAPHLRSLSVKNCKMDNWLADIDRMDLLLSTEDRLEHLSMENNEAIIPLDALRKVLNNASEEFECGPRHLKTYKQSANMYNFDVQEMHSDNMTDFDPLESRTDNMTEHEFLELFGRYLHRITVSEYSCRYTNLETYEETHGSSTNVFFTHLLKINAKLHNLRHVNLSYRGFLDVPEMFSAWRNEFPSLVSLNMSNNDIKRFNMRAFAYDVKGHVDLTYNNISTLGEEELRSFRVMNPVLIDVRNNPYHCACLTADFSDFLNDHDGPEEAGLNPYYDYLWKMTCQSPPELKGRRISEFTREELCRENRHIFVLFVILPLAVLLIVLYFAFRLEVDVFVFAHMGWLWRIGRRKNGLNSKDYDVYVSHSPSDKDTAFVYRELRPRLETSTSDKDRKYKLCLEGRDFQVGAHIAENILTKMAGSRAVVMVLSGDMRVDGWAEFEFQEALFRAVSERRRLLVFLQRGALDTKLLSSALRRALNLFPIIKVGERQFWNKLDYFLKRNASFPVTTSRSCCPCRRRRFDPEKELKEVSRIARADLEKSRQSMRNSSLISALPSPTTPAETTGEVTQNDTVNADYPIPYSVSEDPSEEEVANASAVSIIINGHCSSAPDKLDNELPTYSECVDAPSVPSSTTVPLDWKPEQKDSKTEKKSPQRRDCREDGSDKKAMTYINNKAYAPEVCVSVV